MKIKCYFSDELATQEELPPIMSEPPETEPPPVSNWLDDMFPNYIQAHHFKKPKGI